MPRTFSRGKTFSVEDLVICLPNFLTVEEGERYLTEIRARHCPEPALIEIDIIEQLLELRKELLDLFEHMTSFHAPGSGSAPTSTDTSRILAASGEASEVADKLEAFNQMLV